MNKVISEYRIVSEYNGETCVEGKKHLWTRESILLDENNELIAIGRRCSYCHLFIERKSSSDPANRPLKRSAKRKRNRRAFVKIDNIANFAQDAVNHFLGSKKHYTVTSKVWRFMLWKKLHLDRGIKAKTLGYGKKELYLTN